MAHHVNLCPFDAIGGKTSMGVAYITAGPINVVAGKTYRVAINAPPRGEIVRAQCIQASGTKTTFSFTFYNSAASCPPDPLDATVSPSLRRRRRWSIPWSSTRARSAPPGR